MREGNRELSGNYAEHMVSENLLPSKPCKKFTL